MTEAKEAKKRISVTIVLDFEKRKALRQKALDENTTVQELVSSWIDEGLGKAEVKAVEDKQQEQEQEKKPRTTRASKPRTARKARATATKTKTTRTRKKKSEAD